MDKKEVKKGTSLVREESCKY